MGNTSQHHSSSADAAQSLRRVRRVKTGCRTCKIRKVKCDEARPSCRRCISAGQICDGYGIWGGGNRHGQRPPTQPNQSLFQKTVPLHFVSVEEQTCMEWFIHRTTQKLPGVFTSAFWTDVLPQASTSASAVLHAVLTLSSVHKRQALDDGIPSNSSSADATDLFTLQQYTRATSELTKQIGNSSKFSGRTALISCVVFIHLEYLRGCYKTAMTHLQHGLILLQEVAFEGDRRRYVGCDVVDDWIIRTFTSLCLQAKLFGQDLSEPHFLIKYGISSVGTFQSLNDARHSLELLLLRITSLVSRDGKHSQSKLGNITLFPDQPVYDICLSIQHELDKWLQACEKASSGDAFAAMKAAPSAKDRFAWRLLRVYHTLGLALVTRFLLPRSQAIKIVHLSSGSASCSLTSKTTDYLRSVYESILSQCESLFRLGCGSSILETGVYRPQADGDASQAIADIGWIPPLYHVAIDGDDIWLRQRAIHMLRIVPHREGIWNSTLAAEVAEQVLALEQSAQKSETQACYRNENAFGDESSSVIIKRCTAVDVQGITLLLTNTTRRRHFRQKCRF